MTPNRIHISSSILYINLATNNFTSFATTKYLCCNPPVLNLHEVTNEAVAGTALDKVALRLQELLGSRSAELANEVVQEGHLAVLFDLVKRNGIQNRLDHSAVARRHHDAVRLEPQGDVLVGPDFLKPSQMN